MLETWSAWPDDRPTFEEIARQLNGILYETVKPRPSRRSRKRKGADVMNDYENMKSLHVETIDSKTGAEEGGAVGYSPEARMAKEAGADPGHPESRSPSQASSKSVKQEGMPTQTVPMLGESPGYRNRRPVHSSAAQDDAGYMRAATVASGPNPTRAFDINTQKDRAPVRENSDGYSNRRKTLEPPSSPESVLSPGEAPTPAVTDPGYANRRTISKQDSVAASLNNVAPGHVAGNTEPINTSLLRKKTRDDGYDNRRTLRDTDVPPEMKAPPVPLPNGTAASVDDGYDNRRPVHKTDVPPEMKAPPVPLPNGTAASVDDGYDNRRPVHKTDVPPEMKAPPVPLPNGTAASVDDGYDNRRPVHKTDVPPEMKAPPVPLTEMENGQMPTGSKIPMDDLHNNPSPVKLDVKDLRAKFQ